MTFLDKKPEPEAEFAEEIKQAEAELAAKPEPVSEPETETAAPEKATDTAEPVKTAPVVEKPAEKEKETDDTKVPISALHQARREKQDMERQMQEWANYVQQVQAWAAQQQGQQAEEQPINVADDPLGAMERMRADHQRLQQEMQAYRQQQAQQHEAAAVMQTYKSAAAQFATETKDFKDAYNYAINSRASELQALGMPPHVVSQQIEREEHQLAAAALQNRRNPAQVIYEFAKARGYSGPKPVETAQPAAKIVELQADKAEAATSISTGGKQTPADITDSDGANLKGAAFDAWWDKKFKSARPQSGLFRV